MEVIKTRRDTIIDLRNTSTITVEMPYKLLVQIVDNLTTGKLVNSNGYMNLV